MTLAMAWVRTAGPKACELVFCSDSRLSGGNRFDHATKLFSLPRSDCGLAFAGGTTWAYPMATALARATEIHGPSATRAMALRKYLSHLVEILNQMQAAVHTYASGEEIPDVTFLFGGWDWRQQKFRLWRICFDESSSSFIAHERKGNNGFGLLGQIEFAGDKQYVDTARIVLRELAQGRYGKDMRGGKFDFEPLEVLRDILRASKPEDSVGGAPQLMKVFQHMNTRLRGVYWKCGDQARVPHYAGRPLLNYERADDLWVLDPDSLRTDLLKRGGNADGDHGAGETGPGL